jgi:ethanolaminephosphotransferase
VTQMHATTSHPSVRGPISACGLSQLDKYQYKTTGYSPLDKLLDRLLWTRAVNWLPKWMAPNLVTLTGLMCLVVSFVLAITYCPNLNDDVPRWVLLAVLAGWFAYQTLDAIDGKQARRLGVSGPLGRTTHATRLIVFDPRSACARRACSSTLYNGIIWRRVHAGQLFDHGCDSLGVFLVTLPAAAVMRLGYSLFTLVMLFLAQAPFFMAQWEVLVFLFLRYGRCAFAIVIAFIVAFF